MSTNPFEPLVAAIAEAVAARLRRPEELPQRLLTIEQAARYLGRTPEGTRRLIRLGKLRTVRMDDRVYLDIGDLDAAIEAAKS